MLWRFIGDEMILTILSKWWISFQGSLTSLLVPFLHSLTLSLHYAIILSRNGIEELTFCSDLSRGVWCRRHLRFWLPVIPPSWQHTISFGMINLLHEWSWWKCYLWYLLSITEAEGSGLFLSLSSRYLDLTNLSLCGWVGVFECWTCGTRTVHHSRAGLLRLALCWCLQSLPPSPMECILPFSSPSSFLPALFYLSKWFPFAKAIQSLFLLFVTEDHNYAFHNW